ncbi:MAG TPA: UDP-N-acetyl glucosamine 2-epimerase [Solirubrobacterales bacterium]|nr:UDP-N-acetyl glucosamine 2-epimerase [Solirubrobacterales bacterium]
MRRKVMTVLGNRSEIVRLSRVIETLDRCAEHVVVAIGHNHDPELGEAFLEELGVRAPDHHLGIDAPGSAGRIGQILERIESLLQEHSPDRLLVAGDADSGLSALVAKKQGIHVVHMDAGSRCFDDRVAEEVNRRVIDHSSDLLLPYTEGGRRNLIAEGISPERVMVIGNPVLEVIEHHEGSIATAAETVIERLELTPGEYLLLTVHRWETIEVEERLRSLVDGVRAVSRELDLPVVASVHPRTRVRLDEFGIDLAGGTFGFFDFVALEMGAHLVFTDSVTVQEECCLFGVPAVTLRDSTERRETLECGSNILSGVEAGAIERAARVALDGDPEWTPPEEYQRTDVSSTVARLLLAGS